MAEEHSFLSDSDVYVSNTRIVIQGTTYATANITSVRKHMVPAKNGCAAALAIVGALGAVGGLASALGQSSSDRWTPVVVCTALLIFAISWFRSLPTYHVMIATAGGERQGLTSQDEEVVDRVTGAIADAIVHRG